MAATRHNKIAMNIIDPHVHLFDLKLGDYGWLRSSNPPHWNDKHLIEKDFCQKDLHLSATLNLEGFVHIEAGFDNLRPWREVQWLEDTVSLPFSTIAGFDLTKDNGQAKEELTKLASVVGVRHILDEHASTILAHSQTQYSLQWLSDNNLSFDAQFDLSCEASTSAFLLCQERHPDMTFTLNHGGWPGSKLGQNTASLRKWRANLLAISQHATTGVKLSGWEMCDRQWHLEWAADVIQVAVDVFGDDRVMLASNFPLCQFSHTYPDYWSLVTRLVSAIYKKSTVSKLINQNALNWYKVKSR